MVKEVVWVLYRVLGVQRCCIVPFLCLCGVCNCLCSIVLCLVVSGVGNVEKGGEFGLWKVFLKVVNLIAQRLVDDGVVLMVGFVALEKWMDLLCRKLVIQLGEIRRGSGRLSLFEVSAIAVRGHEAGMAE